LLVAAWICSGRSALQLAKQRYGRHGIKMKQKGAQTIAMYDSIGQEFQSGI